MKPAYWLTPDIYEAAENLGYPMSGFGKMEWPKYEVPLTDGAKAIEAILPNVIQKFLKGLR